MIEFERTRGPYIITTDARRIDLDAVHAYLARSYWAEAIPRAIVEKAIAGSLCFALLTDGEQVGFARVVTDKATFAYLCDVYVLEAHRGQGLGTWMMTELLTHPELQGLRRFMLVTRDAQALYAKVGFHAPRNPDGHMEITVPGLYQLRPAPNPAP